MMMGITAWAQEEKAKRAAWQDNNELKKRIAELEKNLLLAEDLLSDDSYQYYLESTGK
jgi:hypothetical protein